MNILKYYTGCWITRETNERNLRKFINAKIIRLPKINGNNIIEPIRYQITLLKPFARNVNPEIEELYLDQISIYKELYHTVKKEDLNAEFRKALINELVTIKAKHLSDLTYKLSQSVRTPDGVMPTFLLTKIQNGQMSIPYMSKEATIENYQRDLFELFPDGIMDAYSDTWTNFDDPNDIKSLYARVKRRIKFFRNEEQIDKHLMYHNEYDTPLRHGFIVNSGDRNIVALHGIVQNITKHTKNRSYEGYYDGDGNCIGELDYLTMYGSFQTPLPTIKNVEGWITFVNTVKEVTMMAIAQDYPRFPFGIKPSIIAGKMMNTLFDSLPIPETITYEGSADNITSNSRRAYQIYTYAGKHFAQESIERYEIEPVTKMSWKGNTDYFNVVTSITNTNCGFTEEGEGAFEDQHKGGYGIYNYIDVKYDSESRTIPAWAQTLKPEELMDHVIRASNMMRPDLETHRMFELMNAPHLFKLYTKLMDIANNYIKTRVNASSLKMLILTVHALLMSSDKRYDGDVVPCENQSFYYLGAIMEPMCVIMQNSGYRATGIGRNAVAPNYGLELEEMNTGQATCVISDIDGVGLDEQQYTDMIIGMIKKFNCYMIMKCQYSSAVLNARLRAENIRCYFAHLACSTGGKERFLVVNERDIGMTYNEMQGGNFFFGGTHFLLLASFRPIDGPFKPVILRYSGSEVDKINYIAQISDNAVCTTKGDGSQYYVSGLVTQKSISNYRIGTAVPQHFIGMKMPSDSLSEPSVTAVDMFELYIDAKIREVMTNSYARYGKGFLIIDIGGKYAHDLPCVGFDYEYVNVNVTVDNKTENPQLDIVYNTRWSFARNMVAIMAAADRKVGPKAHKMILCRNFLFALNLSIAELNETCRQANAWSPPAGCSYYANWFGVRDTIEEHLPTYVCSKFSLYRPNFRYKGRVLIFHTYPSYNVLCNTVGLEADRLIVDRLHLYAVFFQKGTYIERPDYINAQLLINLYQCRTLVL